MGTKADKLQYLNGTKTAIKNAIVAKGVAVPDGTTFRTYADKIASIQDVSSLPTQGAKTVTPTTTEQIAVASGTYTTGDVKVAGDANLVAENIAEGVSIFGVTGTMVGGGSSTATVTIVAQTVPELGVYVSTPEGYITSDFVTANNSKQVQVVNNSFVLPVAPLDFDSSSQISGNAQIVDEIPLVAIPVGSETRLVFVYGDCTITV